MLNSDKLTTTIIVSLSLSPYDSICYKTHNKLKFGNFNVISNYTNDLIPFYLTQIMDLYARQIKLLVFHL